MRSFIRIRPVLMGDMPRTRTYARTHARAHAHTHNFLFVSWQIYGHLDEQMLLLYRQIQLLVGYVSSILLVEKNTSTDKHDTCISNKFNSFSANIGK